MPVFRPDPGKLMSSMIFAIEQTLLPELSSERAKWMARMVTYIMSAMAARHDDIDEILVETLKGEAARLGQAGSDDLAAELAGLAMPPTQPGDRENLADAQDRASAALEGAVRAAVTRSKQGDAQARAFVGEVLAGEVALLDRLEPKPIDAEGNYKPASGDGSAVTAERLNQYFSARKFPGRDIRVTKVTPILGGFSKDTFLAHLAGADRPADEVILRREGPFGPDEMQIAAEYSLLDHLHAQGFPVAEQFWLESDPAVIGRPFTAGRKVSGQVVMHSSATRLIVSREEAAEAARQLAATLARLHTTDIRTLGVHAAALTTTAQYIERMLDTYEDYWRAHRFSPQPILAAAFQWARENIPAASPGPAVVHGDACLRNMLFESGRMTALLDWELAHVGDPAEDISYCLGECAGVLSREAFLAVYYDRGGPEYREENARFFELWRVLRNSVLSLAGGFAVETDAVPDLRLLYSGFIYHSGYLRQTADFMKTI